MKKKNVNVGRKLGVLLISIATVGCLCSCGAKESQSDIEKSDVIAEVSTSEENVDDKKDVDFQDSTDVKKDIDDSKDEASTSIEDASDEKDNSDNENVAYIDIIGIDKHFRNSKLGDTRKEVSKAESERLYTDFGMQEDYGDAIAVSAKNVKTTAGNIDVYYLFKDDILFQGMILFGEDTRDRMLTKYSEVKRGFEKRFGEPKEQAEDYGEDASYISVWEVDGVDIGLSTMEGRDGKTALYLIVME